MDILTKAEIDATIAKSEMMDKYNQQVDRESAHEILTEKMEKAFEEEKQEKLKAQREKAKKTTRSRRKEKSMLEEIIDSPTTRQIARTFTRELTRGLLGVLGVGGSTSRKRKRK